LESGRAARSERLLCHITPKQHFETWIELEEPLVEKHRDQFGLALDEKILGFSNRCRSSIFSRPIGLLVLK
jgi:hypothetical protein